MKRNIILLCAVFGLALATDPFLQFAKENGKQYKSAAELQLRRSIFEDNYDSMMAHNARFAAGEETWDRKVTPYYDQTQEEFVAVFASGLPAYDKDTVFVDHVDEAYLEKLNEVIRTDAAPASWNWVSQGAISSVKNQGQCGSCAAFASVAVIETCFWQRRGVMFDDLSEQHIVSCANNHYYYDNEGAWGAFGCDGAWPPAYFDWIVKNNAGHIQTESAYPYTATTGSCHPKSGGDFGSKVTGMYNLWNTNERDMKELVYINPVTTSILASYLGDYNSGIYNDSRCCEQATDPNCKYNLNHEVTVVGYGTQSGMDYWLIKNSWDTRFGENGYFKIKRGTGHCGVGALHYTSAYCSA
jgi:cathepsin L